MVINNCNIKITSTKVKASNIMAPARSDILVNADGTPTDILASHLEDASLSNNKLLNVVDSLTNNAAGVAALRSTVSGLQLENVKEEIIGLTLGAIAVARLPNIGPSQLLGRKTNSTGKAEILTPTDVRSIINVQNGATLGSTWNDLTTIPTELTDGRIPAGLNTFGYIDFSRAHLNKSLLNVDSTANTKLIGIAPGADVTSANVAASISGQGALATKGSADWKTEITGTGKPQDGATLGSTWNSDITNQPTDTQLLNINTTPGDIGYTGALNATKGAILGSDLWKAGGTVPYLSTDIENAAQPWNLIQSIPVDLTDGRISAGLNSSGYIDFSKPHVNKSLLNVDGTANTKLIGIESGSTKGGYLGTNIYSNSGNIYDSFNLINSRTGTDLYTNGSMSNWIGTELIGYYVNVGTANNVSKVTPTLASDTAEGGSLLQITDYTDLYGIIYPFNPIAGSYLHIKARVRVTANGTGTTNDTLILLGLLGLDQNKTIISYTYPIMNNSHTVADGWIIVDKQVLVDTYYNTTTVKYVQPIILNQYNRMGQGGTIQVDYIHVYTLAQASDTNLVNAIPAATVTNNAQIGKNLTINDSTYLDPSSIPISVANSANLFRYPGGGIYNGALNANYITNTAQLTDTANLGGKADWGSVNSRPIELTDGRIPAGLNNFGYIDFSRAHLNKSLLNVDPIANTKLTGIAPLADVTGANVAASIFGQGAFATKGFADWKTEITGTGKPQDNASTTSFTLVPTTGTTITGNSATKTGGVNNWGQQAYTKESYTGGCFASFSSPQSTGILYMVGLSTNPTLNTTFNVIEYAIYLTMNGPTNLVQVYESGIWAGNFGSYSTGDTFAVIYDGYAVKYYHSGTLFYTSLSTGLSKKLYLDIIFYTVGSTVNNINFGPLSSAPWQGINSRPIELTDGRIPAGLNNFGYIDFSRAHVNKSLLNVDGPANTKLTGIAPLADVTGANNSSGTIVRDVRNDNQLPTFYRLKGMGSFSEFKLRSVISAPGVSVFGVLGTKIPWGDTSGGVISQIFRSDDGEYRRVGTANDLSWSVWGKSYDGINKPDWTTDLLSRPTELTDGRISAGLNNFGYIDFSRAHLNKSLLNVDPTANTKLGGIETGSTVGDPYGSSYNLLGTNSGPSHNVGYNYYLHMPLISIGLKVGDALSLSGLVTNISGLANAGIKYIIYNSTNVALSAPQNGVTGLGTDLISKFENIIIPVGADNITVFSLDLGTANNSTVRNVMFNRGPVALPYMNTNADGADVANTQSFVGSANMTITGNTANKTIDTGQSWANADQIYSNNTFTGGALAAARAVDLNHEVMFGLNTDPTTDSSYVSLDYAWFFGGDGIFRIYESGAIQATFGTYTTTMLLQIVYDGDSVKYYQDGTLKHTTPHIGTNIQFYFDSSFKNIGAGLKTIQFTHYSPSDWNGITGVNRPQDNASATSFTLVPTTGMTVTGNSATKSGGALGWNEQVSSKESYTGGCFVSFTAVNAADVYMIGLSLSPLVNSSYSNITYAMYISMNGTPNLIQIYESGAFHGSISSYNIGDTFAVIYDGYNIKYYHNGTLIYTSTSPGINKKLYLDSSFYNIGDKVTNLNFGPLSSAPWQGINSRPIELTDGRIPVGLNSSGTLISKVLNQTKLPPLLAGGAGASFTVTPIASSTDTGTNVTLNINASVLQLGSISISYNSGSIIGLAYSTTYYVYGDDPNYTGGAITYIATTNIHDLTINDARIYFGGFTTVASGGGTGGGPPPPPSNCVDITSYINNYKASDAKAGSDILILNKNRTNYKHYKVQSVDFSKVPSVKITTTSGCQLILSRTTPLTLQDGSNILVPEGLLSKVAVLDRGLFKWEEIIEITDMGDRDVAHIHINGNTYGAGIEQNKLIFTHNAFK